MNLKIIKYESRPIYLIILLLLSLLSALNISATRLGCYTDYYFAQPGPFYSLEIFVKWEVAPEYGFIYPAFCFSILYLFIFIVNTILAILIYNNTKDRLGKKVAIILSILVFFVFFLNPLFGIIIYIVINYALRSKKSIITCPYCGSEAIWISKYNSYYCHVCRKYIYPESEYEYRVLKRLLEE